MNISLGVIGMYDNLGTKHIEFIESPEVGVCFSSGRNVYNECLCKGHYVCNLRSAKGKVKRSWVDKWNDSSWVKDLIGTRLVESFVLEIDGQLLKSHWEWVKGYEIENEKVKHGVVELKHGVRPLRVKIHTKCDGSQFIERWIEIVNDGDRYAALSRVSPISGMLWHMQNYKSLTKGQNDSIFTLGYYGDTTPGREGNFVWKPLENGEFSIINKQGRSGWGVPYLYGMDSKNWWPGKLGDWDVINWNKNGFTPLREYIHAKGMLFGLWMEPEAVGHESEIYKIHPDWIVKRDGESIGNGTLLDLSKKEVSEWVEAEVIRVIREYKPDYFKIDFNRIGIGEEGQNVKNGYVENSQWGHVETLYRIFDRLRTEFPDLILENCAAGGGRNDLGMVRRCHISCQSDFTVQPKNLIGLNGMTIAYPPEVLRHYYPMQRDFSLYGDMDFQFRVMMLSNPFFIEVFNDLDEKSEDLIFKSNRYIKLYKDFIRPIMPECKVYHHTPLLNMDSEYDWCVLEYVSSDSSRGFAALFHLGEKGTNRFLFRAKGLNPEIIYRVSFDNEGYVVEKDGYFIMNEGISVSLEHALSSQLLIFEEV